VIERTFIKIKEEQFFISAPLLFFKVLGKSIL